MTNILYIAGYGRSGSTIIDILLGNQPGHFGSGELANIFSDIKDQRPCTCGDPLDRCVFWGPIIDELFQNQQPGLTLDEADVVTRKVERIYPTIMGISRQEMDTYATIWNKIFEGIEKQSGSSWIIDSSKSSYLTARRFITLQNIAGQNVKVVHLIRDPRSVVHSFLKGNNKKLELGEKADYFLPELRALIGWTITNEFTRKNLLKKDVKSSVILKYEDFMLNPLASLQKIESLTGIDMQHLFDFVTSHEELDSGHGISGNRLRRKKTVLRLNVSLPDWKNNLSRRSQLICRMFSPWASRYGYDLKTPF